ncbi:unnamed protein product [Ophioblennius macclurei]
MSGHGGGGNEVLAALRELCGRGGFMRLPELYERLRRDRRSVSEDDFCSMVLRTPCFLLVRGPQEDGALRAEDCAVVARTSLRLCTSYMGGEPCGSCGSCGELHVCKHFLYGTCRFGKGRKLCRFSHDLHSEHNLQLLRENNLHLLTEQHLQLLLLQSDPQLLPKVCLHYNKGSCTFSSSCTKVHLCMHFLQGRCMFGHKCNKLHEIDEVSRRHLQEDRGLSSDIVRQLPAIYRNIQHLRAAAANTIKNVPESWCESPPAENGTTICLHFLRNRCRFHSDCRQEHFLLPYRWQKFDGDNWMDLPDMEDIERDFCDPSQSNSGGDWPIDFQTMTQYSWPVRRLSTVSSVLKPPHYTLTTEWRWFYKGDLGAWVEYGQMDGKQRSTSVTSETLEKVFLTDKTTKVDVMKGERTYVISFEDMYQRNLKHNTKRKIRRRPRFVSRSEVQQRLAQERIHTYPDLSQ